MSLSLTHCESLKDITRENKIMYSCAKLLFISIAAMCQKTKKGMYCQHETLPFWKS